MLTPDSLHGVFAAVPIPWKDDGTFDECVFRTDVARLCASGIHGIYTTGSTGEFYALDFEEFRQVIDAFAAETRGTGVLTQAGCTALDSREACRRAAYAAGKEVDGIQVALPFWLPARDAEMAAFFREVACAASGLPLIHYNTARAKRFLGPREYSTVLDAAPTLIGTKFTGSDLSALADLLLNVPHLAHFVGEHILAAGMMLGARGCYSSFALMNPAWMLRFFAACTEGQWVAAADFQRKVHLMMINGSHELRHAGCQDAAIDKARAAVTGFLQCPLVVRAPYTRATEEQVRRLREFVRLHMPELLDVPAIGRPKNSSLTGE